MKILSVSSQVFNFRCISLSLIIIQSMLLVCLLRGRMHYTGQPLDTSISSVCRSELDDNLVCVRDRLVNTRVVEYDTKARLLFTSLVSARASSRDPALITLARYLLDPPSRNMMKLSYSLFKTPQAEEVLRILKSKSRGFFVECGALDGERSSNTIWLEKQLQWQGLLIEVDPYFYSKLRGTQRQAYSINACLSLTTHPTLMGFKESPQGKGALVKNMSPGIGQKRNSVSGAACFPLETLLLALGQLTVDYFSLDIEGYEFQVLQTIPFDRLHIRTLSVEYVHGGRNQKMLDYMLGRGYHMVKKIDVISRNISLFANDYIFVHENYIDKNKT